MRRSVTVLARGATPWNPRWLKAPFLRHGALALSAEVWGPGGLRPRSFVTGPWPCRLRSGARVACGPVPLPRGLPLFGQGAAGGPAQARRADIGALALGVPVAVTGAAVGHPGRAGDRVGLPQGARDDLG